MSDHSSKSMKKRESGTRPKPRIETQIHRRKKVKASFPLKAEWDSASKEPPEKLRMPPGKMKR